MKLQLKIPVGKIMLLLVKLLKVAPQGITKEEAHDLVVSLAEIAADIATQMADKD